MCEWRKTINFILIDRFLCDNDKYRKSLYYVLIFTFIHSFSRFMQKTDGWKIITNSKYKDSKNLYNLSLWIVNRHHLYCRQLLQIQNPFHHQPHQSRQWDSLNLFRFSRATLRHCRSLIKYMGELIFLSLFIWIGLLCLPWNCYKISSLYILIHYWNTLIFLLTLIYSVLELFFWYL